MAYLDVETLIKELTVEEKANLCSGRDFWKTQDVTRLGIPSVMMCDGPNGLRKQLGQGDHLGINESIETVCYPTESAVASSFDTELIAELGEMLGEECQAEKVGMLLGPGVNIKRSPLCGRNFEYFSEDPYLAGEMASAYIKGLQSKGVAACVKHFAVNNQETRRMSGSSNVDERTLYEIYLPAFKKAVLEGKTRGIMCAYNAVNGTFCAENKSLLTDILRDQWGYQGFVVTDWGAVKDRVKGLLAGVDLEMPGAAEGKTKAITDAVADGKLPEEVLDEAVRNVLTFVKNTVEQREESSGFDREKGRRLSEKIARESAVLLKNENQVLPLSEEESVYVTGEFAKNPRYQGAGSSHIHVSHPLSFLEYAKTQQNNVTYIEDAGMLLKDSVTEKNKKDKIIVFAGLPESYETEGCDRTDIRIPEEQNEMIEKLTEQYAKVIVVLHGGSVMALPWRNRVQAILMMHLAGDRAGAAIYQLLYGKANPCGRLSETWPVKVEDNPSYLNFPGEKGKVTYQEGIFVGYRYYQKKKMEVQYPFGYGLSYTKFTYSNLKISADKVTEKDSFTVSADVTNIGKTAGKEVVQLYVSHKNSEVNRAVRELKGFHKVELDPGETKTVKFELSAMDFAYYETEIHDWFLESGEGRIEIGASAEDIRLTGAVAFVSEMELPLTVTKTTSIGELMKTKKGREFVVGLMSKMGIGQDEKKEEKGKLDDSMGEGSEKMRQQMMFEMPLNALVSYGVMPEEALNALIGQLNEG